MVEISISELSILENTLASIRETVSRLGENSEELQQIIERIAEAEQIVLSKLNKKILTLQNDKLEAWPSLHLKKEQLSKAL